MTKASREGRRLRIEIDEGLEFLIDPISAARGRYLTNLFVLGALGELSAAQAESIFIESMGAENYARATGYLIDQFEDDIDDPEHLGEYRSTIGPDGRIDDPELEVDRLEEQFRGLRFVARQAPAGHRFESLELRQEEVENLALIAFYWQSVAGMEAVEAFLEEGEGTAGSVKAMTLLSSRLAPSLSRTSRRTASASRTQQGGSLDTTTRPAGAKLVALPATPHSPAPERSRRRGAAFFRR